MCQTLREAPCIPYLILAMIFCCSHCCCSYFTEKQTEAEGNQGEAICPETDGLRIRSQSDSVAHTLNHSVTLSFHIDYCSFKGIA